MDTVSSQMNDEMNLDIQLQSYGQWKQSMVSAIEDYQCWLDDTALSDTESELMLIKSLRLVEQDSITIAFAAEFSRGKTELINALFFSAAGMRLLPSSPGRTTMCPTELFFDPTEKPYLRLLAVETRAEEKSIDDYKKEAKHWTHIELDCDAPDTMQDSFMELLRTKTVSAELAKELGLATAEVQDEVVIPYWRHALISFPHPLLEKGLRVLDTPGLNALGSEPELTLSMLPNAQAMIFVLAADTGVTQSDMHMWQQHICGYRSKHPDSLAVVLNKIDTLNDELMSDAEWEQSIHKQVSETARLLELGEQDIFPLSAKQALIAKIKDDEQALQDSRLAGLEGFLSERILGSQKEILQHKVVDDVVSHMQQTVQALQRRQQNIATHQDDLQSIYNQSEDATGELLLITRKQQTAYSKNLSHLKTSRHIFNSQIDDLLEVVNPEQVKKIVSEGRDEMVNSWTSVGIHQGMQQVFDGLNLLLNDALGTSQTSVQLLAMIYRKFKDEHDIDVQKPDAFDANIYKAQLDQLLREGLEFSNSSSAALMGQQTLAKSFVETIGGQAVAIFQQAEADIKAWKSKALSSLIVEVSEQKKMMESKLDSLRGLSAGQDALDEKISQNNHKQELIASKLDELQALLQAIQFPEVLTADVA